MRVVCALCNIGKISISGIILIILFIPLASAFVNFGDTVKNIDLDGSGQITISDIWILFWKTLDLIFFGYGKVVVDWACGWLSINAGTVLAFFEIDQIRHGIFWHIIYFVVEILAYGVSGWAMFIGDKASRHIRGDC